uniref:Uncharacterized protein n=1 Tax=Avena sativa TaxID=4498 RepID=A0ACD5XGX2_AVESA
MGTRLLRDPINPGMAAEIQRRERDSDRTEKLFSHLLSYIHKALPDPPVSAAGRLSALLPHDDVDRVSRLPDSLLRDIVSRLPVKDAARTAVLSHRWRGVWRSAPLVLVDNDLLPVAGTAVSLHDARHVPSAVSRVLAAHPGPFRCIHLTTSYMEKFQGPLLRWLQLLAVKGVQELVLANRPWPLDLRLPSVVLSIATLTRLYLALWKFPDTAGLPKTTSFPNLRELGLCSVVLENCVLDFILARSPVLETLCLQSNMLMDRLTIISPSLQCVHVIASYNLEITVEKAPHLERLIIWVQSTCKGGSRNSNTVKIGIGHAPALSCLGYLEPEYHTLQVGGTTIKTGTKVSPRTMVPTVKILALKIRFGVRSEAKMLPCFLRCFPNVETLHIESKKTAESTSKLTLEFWEQSGAIECIRSSVKLVIFQNFRGDDCEIRFLEFLLKSARMLSKLVIVYGKDTFTSLTEVESIVEPVFDLIWASKCCSLLLVASALAEGDGLEILNIRRGSDLSINDPFAFAGEV